MFKDVLEGNPIYILDIDPVTKLPEYHVGTLISKTPNNNPGNYGSVLTSPEINLLVELPDGIKKEFCGVNQSSDYAVCGRYRLSISEGQLKPELQAIYDRVTKHLSSMESYKNIADKCESIMRELGISNENYEVRMKLLEARYDSIISSLNKLTELVSSNSSETKLT